jgi:hypothetical protein
MAGRPSTTGNYRYSYSGTDVKVIANFCAVPNQMVLLESAHTISWSVHEAKGQVRALGHRGVKGFARGVRTIGGSLITTVIEDHPMRELMELYARLSYPEDPKDFGGYKIGESGWSIDGPYVGIGGGKGILDINRRLIPRLPPIDIYLSYVSELDNNAYHKNDNGEETVKGLSDPLSKTSLSEIIDAGVWILGVEFVDEGAVTSVNDSVTEMTYSFMARDVKNMSRSRDVRLDPYEHSSFSNIYSLSWPGKQQSSFIVGEGTSSYTPELPWTDDPTGNLLRTIANGRE